MFLSRDRTYATGFVKPKTTALLFDNIWLPNEMILDIEDSDINWLRHFMLATDYGAKAYIGAAELNVGRIVKTSEKLNEIDYYTTNHRNFTIKQYAQSIKRRYNVNVTPIYHEPTQFESDFISEDMVKEFSLLQVCMENFPIIDEDLLEWEQVWAFRCDEHEKIKLRRLKMWLFSELTEKSSEEIKYIFEMELDDYKFALRKHGIMTTVGGFTTILCASATVLQSISNGLMEWIAAGVTITATIGLFTAQQLVDYRETNRKPIAYIYDIADKFKNK